MDRTVLKQNRFATRRICLLEVDLGLGRLAGRGSSLDRGLGSGLGRGCRSAGREFDTGLLHVRRLGRARVELDALGTQQLTGVHREDVRMFLAVLAAPAS